MSEANDPTGRGDPWDEAGLLEMLRQASLRLSSGLTLMPILEAVIEYARRLVGAEDVQIFLCDQDCIEVNMARHIFEDELKPLPLSLEELANQTAASGERQVIPDVRLEPRFSDWPRGGAVVSILMPGSARRQAVLQALYYSPHHFSADELRILDLLADQAGAAIGNALMYEQIQEYASELEERVRLRTAELEQARLAAEAANRSKSDFLANVSHELRTPLTSILGFTRMVQKRLDERILPSVPVEDARMERAVAQVRGNLEIILDEGQRLTALINNLLDLEKIESGKIEWRMQPVQVEAVLGQAAASTAALFEAKHLGLVVQVEQRLPAVTADPDRLVQVVINLLSNAVKFTARGQVTLKARRQADEILVSVTDQGIGIALEDQAAVFERFKQVGDTLTDKPLGSGLGLAICKEIVEHHGGRIGVESQPGQGSTFWFTLRTL